jgi:hypothetical protein
LVQAYGFDTDDVAANLEDWIAAPGTGAAARLARLRTGRTVGEQDRRELSREELARIDLGEGLTTKEDSVFEPTIRLYPMRIGRAGGQPDYQHDEQRPRAPPGISHGIAHLFRVLSRTPSHKETRIIERSFSSTISMTVSADGSAAARLRGVAFVILHGPGIGSLHARTRKT